MNENAMLIDVHQREQEAEGAARVVKQICIEIAAIPASALHNPASAAVFIEPPGAYGAA